MTTVTINEFEAIPTGEYTVNIVDYKQETGQFGEQFHFTIEVIGGEYADRQLHYWTPVTGGMKGKLFKMASAVGIALDAGDEFDLDDLVGKRCMATVVVKERADGTEGNKIDGLKAPRAKKTEKAEPQKINTTDAEKLFENE